MVGKLWKGVNLMNCFLYASCPGGPYRMTARGGGKQMICIHNVRIRIKKEGGGKGEILSSSDNLYLAANSQESKDGEKRIGNAACDQKYGLTGEKWRKKNPPGRG